MLRTYKRAREGMVNPVPMSSPEVISEDTPPASTGGSLKTLKTWLGVSSHLLTQPRPLSLPVSAAATSRLVAPIPLSTSLATNTEVVGVGTVSALLLPWATGKKDPTGGSGCEEGPSSSSSSSSSSAPAAAPSSPSLHHPPPIRMVQLHLDLGQRTFDQTKCRLCAMVYCPGVAEDEALHTSQCARVATGVVTWAVTPKDIVVWGPGEDGIRVIHVQPGEAAHRVEGVAALLLRMLGPHSVPKWEGAEEGEEGIEGEGDAEGGGSSGSSRSSSGCRSAGPPPLHHYIAVGQGGGVVGALSTHLLRPPLTKFVVAEEGELGGLVRKPMEAKAVIGIDQVWVSAGVRRRGVGRALIDAARKHTVYAYTVPVGEVAFSAPTGDGFLLAAAYRGGGKERGDRVVPVY